MPVLVGTSGWQYRHWRGVFYPRDVPQRLWLEYYAGKFGTVENNGTFYRLPARDSFAGWRDRIPENFVMAVKASRYLSHIKRLRDPAEPVRRMAEAFGGLAGKLGPVLLQLPPNLTADAPLLDDCLAQFPGSMRVAVEPRHASWWNDRIESVLAAHGSALCWADRRGEPVTPLWRTAGWGYLRFHEGAADPWPRYGEKALSVWTERIAGAWPAAAPVYAYCNNDQNGAAIEDAVMLARLTGRRVLLPRPAATTERRGTLGSMGSTSLPPFSLLEVVSRWQFAPVVTAAVAVFAGLYLWGAARVRQRHPARPWSVLRTVAFLAGLLVIVVATQSGIGTYDDTLFWDHMIQHLMLIMVAPPLLVAGQPVTLLMHASRNPLHTWTKKVLRSNPVRWITWPAFGVAAYAATIVGTHLTSFMNLVESSDTIHEAEHVLYLVVGYLYFLPLIGREPIRWKVSYPLRLFLLFIAMPVDAFTGVVLGSESSMPFNPLEPRSWGPSPLDDVHEGGAVMWIGGAAIMFVVIMTVFFAWTRETRPSGGMGWLESARRANLADRVAETVPEAAAGASAHAGAAHARPVPARDGGIDEDDAQLAAYNAYLARINGVPDQEDIAREN
jgi:uncharacterized protein YecE (DUF72 family)/cytochrome c oxidase assembly factor CtaG